MPCIFLSINMINACHMVMFKSILDCRFCLSSYIILLSTRDETHVCMTLSMLIDQVSLEILAVPVHVGSGMSLVLDSLVKFESHLSQN